MDDIILSHGSHSGIVGDIRPTSRPGTDFGSGFYMSDNADQALALVRNDNNPKYYEVKLKLSELEPQRILRLYGMDWAYTILYHRGKLETIKGCPLYEKYENIFKDRDIIVGNIANDELVRALGEFSDGLLNDKALLESINAVDIGKQYVAVTDKGCKIIEIISERNLTEEDRQKAARFTKMKKENSKNIVEKMRRKYRREGRFLDEIIEEQLKLRKG